MIDTFYIDDMLCTIEEVMHNGHIIIKHGEMKRRYIQYTRDEAIELFTQEITNENVKD